MGPGLRIDELNRLLLEEAGHAGFPLAGAVDIEPALESAFFQEHLRRYDDWLAEGNQGAMQYLERGRTRRADPREVFPEARSLFCVAIPYRRRSAGAGDAEDGVRYARYIDGPDYHEVIAEKLEAVMRRVRERSGEAGLSWKVCVDTSAVLERTWAALAGLGWIGKNTLLIHPKLGSYLFLGEVLINRETGQGPRPIAELCGHCERCLRACPTEAFVERGRLDSRRCISYWTLEKRGESTSDEALKSRFGSWIAGCDLCQETCPFNLKPSRMPDAQELPSASDVASWSALLSESPEQYRERIRDSALSRVKPEQFSRNLAIAVRNTRPSSVTPDDVRARLARESDPVAVEEWTRTLEALAVSR